MLCRFFLLFYGDFKIIFFNAELTNITFVYKLYKLLDLFNVHIYKLNLCYGKRAAKIGTIYQTLISKNNKKG